MGNESPERKITYFASTHTRGKQTPFGIRAIDRLKHMYVIGKTGMGKSTLLENLAIQDIQNGEGLCFIDPHGSTAEKLLEFIPQERIGDVLYLAPFDLDSPIGFNVMEDVGYDKRHLVASGLMSVFKRIWVDAWSARMEYILQNTLLALLEYPDSTLLDVNRMLINKEFRKAVVANITDPVVKSFWVEEFATYTDRYTQEATPAIQNKIGQFTSNPLIRNIVGQPKSSFDVRKMMDEKKIIIVNLSKGRIGETNTVLLGSLLTVKLYLGALSRADESLDHMRKLPSFYFYVDEFQSVANDSFANILSEARKYKLALIIANQYIEQMEENVRNAVFGNVGTMITFRVGPMDAEVMRVIFEPTFTAEDLVGLGVGAIYLTLMIDGVGSPPFSAQTLPPIDEPSPSFVQKVIAESKARYGRPRDVVEKDIQIRSEMFRSPEVQKKEKEKDPTGVRRPVSVQVQPSKPSAAVRTGNVNGVASQPAPRQEVCAEQKATTASYVPRPARSPLEIMREKARKRTEMEGGESKPLPPPPKEPEPIHPLRDALKAALKDVPVPKKEESRTAEIAQSTPVSSDAGGAPDPDVHTAPRTHAGHVHQNQRSNSEQTTHRREPTNEKDERTHEDISEELIRRILYGGGKEH